MTDRISDLLPQGSIPQVLELGEALRFDMKNRELSQADIHGQFARIVEGECRRWGRRLDELLTALRSLPPAPMQQVIADMRDAVDEKNQVAYSSHPDSAPVCLVEPEALHRWIAALRSLASPPETGTQPHSYCRCLNWQTRDGKRCDVCGEPIASGTAGHRSGGRTPFATLRAQMSPEAQARAATRTAELLAEMQGESLASPEHEKDQEDATRVDGHG